MKALLAVLLFPALACAQTEQPTVKDSEFDVYDLESMKAGEWVLKESVSKLPMDSRGAFATVSHRERLACVRVDEDKVWIESSNCDLEAKELVFVRLWEVDRKTRKVLKAWESMKGAVAQEAKVEKGPERQRQLIDIESDSGKNSETAVKEKLKVGTTEVDCTVVKIENVRTEKNDKTVKTTCARWFSAEVPFRMRVAEVEACVGNQIPETASKDLKTSQACVKLELATSDDTWKIAESIVDFGTDAKPTVKTK
ncbi:MAG: hypothetical protein K8T20_12990 [Planctomycetes bacterium]|nr:hypothetical protein [Planctomycetota bacterium]